MKIRNGYVSNSSSSSYIVDTDLNNKGIACLELTEQQKKLINGFKSFIDETIEIDVNKPYYLTEYIYGDKQYDEIKKVKHMFYDQGELNGSPRNEEYYNEYQYDFTSVYLRKEHDIAKQMSFNKFVQQFKKDFGNIDIRVKYQGNNIILTRIF